MVSRDAFLLIAADNFTLADKRVPAHIIATHRLNLRKWPIFAGTRNRRVFKSGDDVLIYLAGKGELSGHVVAQTRIAAARPAKPHEEIDPHNVLATAPVLVLELCEVRQLDPPVRIKSLLSRLSFVSPGPRWGAALMGGCRRLSAADYEVLTASYR